MITGVRPSSRALASWSLDEGAVIAMAPSALLRCEQPVGGVAVADGTGEVRRAPPHLVVGPRLAQDPRLEPGSRSRASRR